MPNKKIEEEVEGAPVGEAAAEEAVEAAPAEEAVEAAPAEEAAEAAPAEEAVEAAPAEETVEAAPAAPAKSKKAPSEKTVVKTKVSKKKPVQTADDVKKVHKRAEKVGIVASDKMTKTVTVRVDRLVKHPIYRKYVKRRKKFMAHDELGARIGDKVKIVETRPLSARKRWRVVEIIQRAEL